MLADIVCADCNLDTADKVVNILDIVINRDRMSRIEIIKLNVGDDYMKNEFKKLENDMEITFSE